MLEWVDTLHWCLEGIMGWRRTYTLKLDPGKTEVLLVGSRKWAGARSKLVRLQPGVVLDLVWLLARGAFPHLW